MIRYVFILCTLVIYAAGGCGPAVTLNGQYKSTTKGVKKAGDVVYLFVTSDREIVGDLYYSVDDSQWVPIKNKQDIRAKKLKKTNNTESGYGIKFVLRLPPLNTDNLRFKVSAVTAEGTRSETIIPVDETIDSVRPKSKVTFNPFTLER